MLLDATTKIGEWLQTPQAPHEPLITSEGEAQIEAGCRAKRGRMGVLGQTADGLRFLFTICQPSHPANDNATLDRLQLLAQHAVRVLERTLLKTENDLLAKIADLSNRCASRELFLQEVVPVIRTALAASGCSILLRDEARGKLVLAATTGVFDPRTNQPLETVDYKMGEGCTGWIWKHRRAVRLFDARDRAEWLIVDPSGKLEVLTKSAETHEGDRNSPGPFLGRQLF